MQLLLLATFHEWRGCLLVFRVNHSKQLVTSFHIALFVKMWISNKNRNGWFLGIL